MPKRRGRPLRSAPKPCLRLVTSHGSSKMRSIVTDTLCCLFGMPLVVAVSVKSTLVTEFFSTSLTLRSDMINLYLVLIPEVEFTPSAFSLLFL